MKNLIITFCLALIFGFYSPVFAQESTTVLEEIPLNYKKRSPIYDYTEAKLNNTDTIPEFATQKNKLKIVGTIYENDGVTPAKDVLLFIHHSDENGDFDLRKYNKKRYVHHRGWIKTDADGRYTFYTFVPGSYIHGNELKQILPIIKGPNSKEYEMETFLFDNDPLLTDECRSKIKQTDGSDRILTLDKKEGLLVAKRDIILGKDRKTY